LALGNTATLQHFKNCFGLEPKRFTKSRRELLHEYLQRVNWQSLAKQMSLVALATKSSEQVPLVSGYYAFDNNTQTDTLCQANDRACYRCVVWIGQDVFDKRAVNF